MKTEEDKNLATLYTHYTVSLVPSHIVLHFLLPCKVNSCGFFILLVLVTDRPAKCFVLFGAASIN